MLNDKIKTLREARKMSQTELAKEFNITKQTVSNWESGYINPSITKLKQLAEFFNVSTDYLLDLESNNSIDITNLTDEEVGFVSQIVNDLKNKNKKKEQ